jgi:hypothetical protein
MRLLNTIISRRTNTLAPRNESSAVAATANDGERFEVPRPDQIKPDACCPYLSALESADALLSDSGTCDKSVC